VQSDLSLEAEYKKQYYVTVDANGGSVSGEGWYDEASTASIVANTPCNEVQQKSRKVFTQWAGGSTSDVATISITVDNPYSFTANWKSQYYLSVNSNHGSTLGSGWYDANSLATFSIQSTSEIGNDTRKYFTGWSGDANTIQSSSTITMDSSKSVSAMWRVQYLLNVVSSYGDPTGQDWYDSGTAASISVNSIVDSGNGTRRVFIAWIGEVSTTTSPATSVTVDKPKTVVVQWKTQYKVSFTASGLPDGTPMNFTINSDIVSGTTPFTYSDWYDSQVTLKLNVTSKIANGFRVYVFNHWANSTAAKVSDTITIDGPDTLTAIYNQSFGCIIATATFGSELSPEVQFLRDLRDQKIMMTFAGSHFMIVFNAWYYSFSPAVAATIANNQILRDLAKLILYPLVGILHLSALTYNVLGYNSEWAVVVAGFAASYMIGTVYFAPLLAAALALTRRRIWSIRKVQYILCILVGSFIGIAVADALQLDLLMMLSSALFVLATVSLSAMLSAGGIFLISRKLNWSRLRSLQP
jgi:hypothetical protein